MSDRERIYENARKKSVGEEKRVRYVKMKRDSYINSLKATFIAGSLITILVAGGVSLVKDKLDTMSAVGSQTHQYQQIVNENTHRTLNNDGYWYDTDDIATEISKNQENIDDGIYGVYSNIGYNNASRLEQMDDVIRFVKFADEEGNLTQKYSSFDEYLTDKGFANEDGQVNYKDYEKAMQQILEAKAQLEQAERNIIK